MKKIIAMLLCVALVAAMGVTAFAGSMGSKLPTAASKTETFTVAEWIEYLKTPGTYANDLAKYADNLSKAKAAYANEIKAWNDQKDTIVKAVQAAQYATIAAYVDAAWAIAQAEAINNINEAIAEFSVELAKVYQDAATNYARVGGDPTNPIFGIG